MSKPRKRGRPPKFDPKEGAMRTTTISLDERSHLALRHLALDRGVAFRDLIRDAIREYLARTAKKEGR